MKRRDFLKRLSISTGATVLAPTLLLGSMEPDAVPGWDSYPPNAFSDSDIVNKWQHHESLHLVKGQHYKVQFDYIMHSNEPLSVTIDNQGIFKISIEDVKPGEEADLTIADISLKQMKYRSKGIRNLQTVDEFILSKARL